MLGLFGGRLAGKRGSLMPAGDIRSTHFEELIVGR